MVVSDVVEIFYLLIWVLMMRMYSLKIHYLTLKIMCIFVSFLLVKSLFSNLAMSGSLWSHGLQHTRLPCPSLYPSVYSNSCPLSQWCCPTLILCCPPLLLPPIFPSIRVFSNESALHVRCPRIGASASASVFPMTIQGWFPLGLTGLVSLQSKKSSPAPVWRHQFFGINSSMLSHF